MLARIHQLQMGARNYFAEKLQRVRPWAKKFWLARCLIWMAPNRMPISTSASGAGDLRTSANQPKSQVIASGLATDQASEHKRRDSSKPVAQPSQHPSSSLASEARNGVDDPHKPRREEEGQGGPRSADSVS